MKKKFVDVIFCIALLGGSGAPPAQVAPQSAPAAPAQSKTPQNPISWAMAAAPNQRAIASRTLNVVLTAKIEPGWHLYSMAQPVGGPIAMTVSVPKPQPFAAAATVVEPVPIKRVDPNFPRLGETLTFDDQVAFTVPVRIAAGTRPGSHPLRVDVRYQVCSTQLCLAPRTVGLRLQVIVGGEK